MSNRRLLALGAAGSAMTLAGALNAYNPEAERYWPQWRGPSATGVSKNATPPLEWSETRNIRWKKEIPGSGSGTPVIWGDKLLHSDCRSGACDSACSRSQTCFSAAPRARGPAPDASLHDHGARPPGREGALGACRSRGSAARKHPSTVRHVRLGVSRHRRRDRRRVVRVARHLRVRHERQAALAERSRRQVDAQPVRGGQHARPARQFGRRRLGSPGRIVHRGARQEDRQRALACRA